MSSATGAPKQERLEERYAFQRLSDTDFCQALTSLRLIRAYRRNAIREIILRDALVAYARPFSANRGKSQVQHSLMPSIVPVHYSHLHATVLELRNTVFAHTDIAIRNPRRGKWKAKTGFVYPTALRGFPLNELLASIGAITEMIEAVRLSNLKQIQSIEAMYF